MITIFIGYSKSMPSTTATIEHSKDWESISQYRGNQGGKMDPSKDEMLWEVLSTITIGYLLYMKMPMDRIFTYYRLSVWQKPLIVSQHSWWVS
jgi:hypothetical protein